MQWLAEWQNKNESILPTVDLWKCSPLKDSSGFISNAHNLCASIILSKLTADMPCNTSVHSSTETTIRCDSNEQPLRFFFLRLHICLFIEGLNSFTVRTSLLKFTLGSGVFRSRHHLHGLSNFLDILDRLESNRNGLKGGHPSLLLKLLPAAKVNFGQALSTGYRTQTQADSLQQSNLQVIANTNPAIINAFVREKERNIMNWWWLVATGEVSRLMSRKVNRSKYALRLILQPEKNVRRIKKETERSDLLSRVQIMLKGEGAENTLRDACVRNRPVSFLDD